MSDDLDLLALVKADTLDLRKAHNFSSGAFISSEPSPDNDLITGTAGADTISALAGDDCILGKRGADVLSGDDGDDELYGGAGRDRLLGGTGDDRLNGGARADTFEAGDGIDRLYLNGGQDRVVFELSAGDEGRDTLFGFTIGKDKVLLEDYTPSGSALSLTSSGGNAVVTFTETGQQVKFDGLSFADLQANVTSIFQIV